MTPESTISTEEETDHGEAIEQPVGHGRQGTLEEVPPEDVRRAGEEREAESTPEHGGRANEERLRPNDRGRNAGGRGLGSGEGEVPVPADREGRPSSRRESKPDPGPGRSGFDYRITTKDDIGGGGPRVKYARNIEAIKTLLAIEAEGRSATPEEQSKLVLYSGWGWTGNGLFNQYDYGWSEQRRELLKLIGQQAYDAARKSTQNAHYTSPEVITPIWDAVRRLGFEAGRILEPSAGIGHFYGLMPRDMWNQSRKTAVELDPTSGRILRQLYQTAETFIQGFEQLLSPDNYYDLAISNVPFGKLLVHDPAYNKYHLSIHNYFITKMLDKVRPHASAISF